MILNDFNDDSFIYQNIIDKYNLSNEKIYNFINIYYYDSEICKLKLNIKDTKKNFYEYIIQNYKLSTSTNKIKLKKTQNLILYLNKYLNILNKKIDNYKSLIKFEIDIELKYNLNNKQDIELETNFNNNNIEFKTNFNNKNDDEEELQNFMMQN